MSEITLGTSLAQGNTDQRYLAPLDEILKRLMELLIALTLGILTLPVLLLAALLIRWR